MGCWRTLCISSWCKVTMTSDRRIYGSCRPTSACICSRRQPEDPPSCLVGVVPPSGPYPTPSSYPPGRYSCKRWCTFLGHCNWSPLHFCWEISLVTRCGTSCYPVFHVHFPGIYGHGLYPCVVFLHSFWSGVGVKSRLWKPYLSPRG